MNYEETILVSFNTHPYNMQGTHIDIAKSPNWFHTSLVGMKTVRIFFDHIRDQIRL